MTSPASQDRHPAAVFWIFLRLGLTSFGGPIAHLGYFHEMAVSRRKWLSDRDYADLVALCQFLPGPASSQVGLSLGLLRAGYSGAIAAWAGFTLPSAAAMMVVALGFAHFRELLTAETLQGLKIVAVAVVAQAVWGMARKICINHQRSMMMVGAAAFALVFPTSLGQIGLIAASAGAGLIFFSAQSGSPQLPLPIKVSERTGVAFLLVFLLFLGLLPVLTRVTQVESLAYLDAFYRTGSLVFGGGHVVLPLLQAEVVNPGWVSRETFLTGYGAAQAVPGPLFSFAAYLGTSLTGTWAGIWLGLLCLAAIYLPSFLLVFGVIPFWERLRRNQRMQAMFIGLNVGVVGLLLAAFIQPVWTSAIHQFSDFVIAALAFTALTLWKAPAWLVVMATGFTGWLITYLPGLV